MSGVFAAMVFAPVSATVAVAPVPVKPLAGMKERLQVHPEDPVALMLEVYVPPPTPALALRLAVAVTFPLLSTVNTLVDWASAGTVRAS